MARWLQCHQCGELGGKVARRGIEFVEVKEKYFNEGGESIQDVVEEERGRVVWHATTLRKVEEGVYECKGGCK